MNKIQNPAEVKKVAAKNTQKQRRVIYEKVKAQLDANPEVPAVGMFIEDFVDKEDLVYGDDHFKIIPVRVRRKDKDTDNVYKKRTGFYAVFDANRVELNSEIELRAPKGKGRMYVGTGAWQVQRWCKKLGLKRINVVEI